MTRILIAGVPKAGKTTLADQLLATWPHGWAGEPPVSIRHTDDLITQLDWSAVSHLVASEWMQEQVPWIIEGVAVPRALRKWLLAHPGEKPAELVYWSATSKVPLTKGQATMAKGCIKVWNEVREELVLRGVEVRHF